MSDNPHQQFMTTALELAKKGAGSVEPNPLVGAVIVKGDQIIAKGWHKNFGGPHAEINAIENCKDHRLSCENATMYVTLEPCCHYGKTPPCADAIIKAGFSKIFIAMADPSHHCAGKGIAKLRQAGIDVELGLCQKQAENLNPAFIKYAETKKTFVTLKWAQSIDGQIAWDKTQPDCWISNEKSRQDVHLLRRRCQAVLVGINTVLHDDPMLTPCSPGTEKIIRVVLDSGLRIPLDSKLIQTAGDSPVIVATTIQTAEQKPHLIKQLESAGAELLITESDNNRVNLETVLDHLAGRAVQRLLVEGGATVITEFLNKNLADEVIVYIAPKILTCRGSVDISDLISKLKIPVELKNVNTTLFDGDIRISGCVKK